MNTNIKQEALCVDRIKTNKFRIHMVGSLFHLIIGRLLNVHSSNQVPLKVNHFSVWIVWH